MSQVIAALLKRDAQLKAAKGNQPLNPTFDQPPKNRQYPNQNQQFPPPIQDNRNYTPNFPSNNYQTNQYNPNIPYNQNFGRKGRMRGNFNINNQFNPYPNQMNPQNRNFNQPRFPNQQNYQGQEYNNNRNFQQSNNRQNKYPTPQRFNRAPNQYQDNQNNYYPNKGRGNNYQPKPQQIQQAFMKFAQSQNKSQDNFRANNRGRSRGRRDYNERGNQFNEVRKERYTNERFNRNEITDNRPLTSKQTEQRTKKFVNLNKQPQLRTYQGPKNISRPQKYIRKKSYEKPKRQQRDLPSKPKQEQESYSQEDISQQKMKSNQQQQEERSYDSKQKKDGQSSDSQQEYQQNQNGNQQQQYEEEQYQSKYSDKQDIRSKSERSQQQKSMNQVHRQQSQRMCSNKEFNNRKKIFIENNHGKIQSDPTSAFQMRVVDFNLSLDTSKSFSIFQLNKKSYLPDLSLTLKKFQRSANRAEDGVDQQQAYVPRNKQGLIAAMNHIKKYILDSDTKLAKQLPFPLPQNQKKIQFIQIYVFLWDRMREMIKDITRLSEQSKHDAEIIKICQQITRFFILSINEGRKNYQNQLTFDDKMNKQSLVKVMTPLLGLYANSKIKLIKLIKQMQQKSEQLTIQNVKRRMQKQGIYISPNEPQITSYAILFSEDYRKYLYENIFVGIELHEHNPLYQSKQIQQVLSIKSALALKNYEKYFQILQDQNYGYLLSCLMSLNIHQIRKDISQKFQYSFRYMDEGTRKKGIYSNYFRNSLHFTKDQVKQYDQFLKTVDGVKGHNKLITWDHQLPEDDKIYKSPAYALDFKLKRKYFQNSSQRGQTKMSRVEIVSRSWKKSTYIEQIISCFLHQQYSPISISPIREKDNNQEEDNQDKNQVIISSTPIKKPQKQPEKVSISQAQALINNKLQQINRKKFIQNFSLKLIELFRPDETKEQKKLKSVKDLLNVLLKKQQALLIKVFDRLDEVTSEKIQKQIYLIKLQQYIKVRKDFQAQFKKQRNQVRDEQPTNQGMSSLLKLVQKTKLTKKKQIMKLQNLLIKNKIKQFNFKLFIDLNYQDPNYSLVLKVINNIFYYVLGTPKIFKRNQNKTSFVYLHQPIQNKINLSIISLAQNKDNWKQLFAADSVIYLQTSKSDKGFTQIIDEFKEIKNCIKEYPDYTLPIAVIKLYDSSQPIQFQNSSFAPLLDIQQYLKASALQISSFLCLSLNGFLNTSILRYRKRPNITTISLKQIIKQISLNGQFIYTQIANSSQQQLFIGFQSYVNLCLEQIFRLSKVYYTAAHLFSNWLDLQFKIDDCTIYNQNAQTVKQNMIRQYNELKNLEQRLKFVSPFENLQHKVILNNNDFIIHYFNFLKRFDFQNVLNYATISSMVQILKFKQGKIEGDISEFYKELLTMLGKMIQNFFIIAPVDFRFSLNPKDLLNKLEQCETKINNKIKQQQEMISYTQNFKPKASTLIIFKQENKKDDLSNVKKRPRKEFKYERAKWLEDVKKQIKLA